MIPFNKPYLTGKDELQNFYLEIYARKYLSLI